MEDPSPPSSCSYRIRGRVSLHGITEGRWIMVLKGCDVCRYTLRRYRCCRYPRDEGDIGSRRRQTGTLLPSSSHSPSALGEYPRKCNLPSIQPLISKELLEPVSMYIYIYIFLSAMDALSGTRRGGEADVAARLAKIRGYGDASKNLLWPEAIRVSQICGDIYVYIYFRTATRSKRVEKNGFT